MNVGSATRRYLPVGVTARRKLCRFYSNEGRKSSVCRRKRGSNEDDEKGGREKEKKRKKKKKRRGRYVRDKSFSLRDIWIER